VGTRGDTGGGGCFPGSGLDSGVELRGGTWIHCTRELAKTGRMIDYVTLSGSCLETRITHFLMLPTSLFPLLHHMHNGYHFNENGLVRPPPAPVDAGFDNKTKISPADMLSGLLLEVNILPQQQPHLIKCRML